MPPFYRSAPCRARGLAAAPPHAPAVRRLPFAPTRSILLSSVRVDRRGPLGLACPPLQMDPHLRGAAPWRNHRRRAQRADNVALSSPFPSWAKAMRGFFFA